MWQDHCDWGGRIERDSVWFRFKRNLLAAVLIVDSKGSKADAGWPGGRPLESFSHCDDWGLIQVVPLEVMMWFWLHWKAELRWQCCYQSVTCWLRLLGSESSYAGWNQQLCQIPPLIIIEVACLKTNSFHLKRHRTPQPLVLSNTWTSSFSLSWYHVLMRVIKFTLAKIPFN